MAENNSDRNGRALEFVIVDFLLQKLPHLTVRGNTHADQQRDSLKFSALPYQKQSDFIKSAGNIFLWLVQLTKGAINVNPSSIERLTDDAAKKGDVTDIRLIVAGNVINLSIKHNHTALKHQRPTATANQCGYFKKSLEDENYRLAYKKITEDFLQNANNLKPNAQNFNELDAIQGKFIENNLYAPICKLVCDFLNLHVAKQSYNAQHFFSFIVGMTDYHKIVVYADRIEIFEFAFMPLVNSLSAIQRSASYIDVSFSNGWKISMRLHTASSRIKGVSIKFDTQPLNINVPKEIIPF
jgi:hypothetical protein